MDKDYEKKVQEMKIEVMDAKKKFESRIDEFRK
jgi:chromosome segregation ATPase